MSIPVPDRNLGSDQSIRFICFILTISLILIIFWYGLSGMVNSWFRNTAYDKLFVLILFVGITLTMLRETKFRPAISPEAWFGVLLACISLATSLIGRVAESHQIVLLSLISFCCGLFIIRFGFNGAMRFWPVWVSGVLLLEFPAFITNAARHPVEIILATISASGLTLVGVPTAVIGRVLDFGGSVQIPIRTFTGMFDLVPLVIVLAISGLAIRGNPYVMAFAIVALAAFSVLRIVILGLLLPGSGMDAIERLVLYSDALVFALLAAASLRLTYEALRRARASGPMRLAAGLDGARLGLPGAVTAFAVVLSSVLVTWSGSTSAAPVSRTPFSMFPPEMDGWSGTSSSIEPHIARILEADDYLQMFFWHPDETEMVDLWIAYYQEQRPGQGAIHSPEVCLPGDGWNILTLDRTALTAGGMQVPANRAVLERNGQRILVYYWFEGRGRRDASEIRARIAYRVDGFLKGRTDGALVRLTTIIGPGESEAAADSRLRRFAPPVVSRLPRFVPGVSAAPSS